jgi:hypothetical protein
MTILPNSDQNEAVETAANPVPEIADVTVKNAKEMDGRTLDVVANGMANNTV